MKKTLTAIITTAILIAAPLSAQADSRVLTNPVNEWGWDYIDGTMDGKFVSKYNGKGVDIFVVDSGIEYASSNINVVAAKDFTVDAGTANENKDCTMHGNSVASIIAGENFGVANKANIYSAKVFACGSVDGSNYVIEQALNWVDETRTPGKPTVVNMSLRGGLDGGMAYAVNKLTEAGVIVVAAAGNDNQDACSYAPVALAKTIGVGGLNQEFAKADYSNYGSCVDFWAPGSNLIVKCTTQTGYVCFNSGTSLAAPFVTSMVSLFLQNNPKATHDEVMAWLESNVKTVDGLKHVQLPKDYVGDPSKVKGKAVGPAYEEVVDFPTDDAVIKAKVVGKTITVNVTGMKKGYKYTVDLGKGFNTLSDKDVKGSKVSFKVSKSGKYNLMLWYSNDGGKNTYSASNVIDVVVK